MWTLIYSFRAFHLAAARANRSLLGELFWATPLGILIVAASMAPRPPATG